MSGRTHPTGMHSCFGGNGSQSCFMIAFHLADLFPFYSSCITYLTGGVTFIKSDLR